MHFVETVVLAESGIGVDHREQDSRKIEHCDARGQLAHVYKATLAVLHHDIVDIEVVVHATVAVGNEVEKAMQIPSFLFADTRDVCLRCCFLRDETLFRVAAPCGFFYSLRKPFLPACMKTAVLSTAVSLCLRSGVLDVCLRSLSFALCEELQVWQYAVIARLYPIYFSAVAVVFNFNFFKFFPYHSLVI